MDEKKSAGSGKKWFFGCCGGLLFVALFCGALGWFGAGWVKDKSAQFARAKVAEVLEKTELSSAQTESINAQLERLEEAIQGWSLMETMEHLKNLELVEGEFEAVAMHSIILSYENLILPHTELPESERQAGRRILQRFARGLDEGTIEMNERDHSWQLNSKKDSKDEEFEFNPDEVREHLASLLKQVDEAGIPDEDYEVDLGSKIKAVVDGLIDG